MTDRPVIGPIESTSGSATFISSEEFRRSFFGPPSHIRDASVGRGDVFSHQTSNSLEFSCEMVFNPPSFDDVMRAARMRILQQYVVSFPMDSNSFDFLRWHVFVRPVMYNRDGNDSVVQVRLFVSRTAVPHLGTPATATPDEVYPLRNGPTYHYGRRSLEFDLDDESDESLEIKCPPLMPPNQNRIR